MDHSSPRPKFEDITLYDQETGEPFIFTAKEQEFYARQGYQNVPKYTPERRKLKQEQRDKGKEMFNVQCMVCKRVGKINLKPANSKQVLCENCFKTRWEAHLEKHPEIRALHQQAADDAA